MPARNVSTDAKPCSNHRPSDVFRPDQNPCGFDLVFTGLGDVPDGSVISHGLDRFDPVVCNVLA